MTSLHHERGLRRIGIATLFPSLPLLIAAGVMSDNVGGWYLNGSTPTVCYFGIIPTFFSMVISIVFLKLDSSLKDHQKGRQLVLWLVSDFVLAAAYFAVLLPIWIIEPRKLHGHANWMMLETYATCSLILNMGIHGYLVFARANKALHFCTGIIGMTECPHCHENLLATKKSTRNTREGYSLLQTDSLPDDDDGEANTAAGLLEEV